MRKHSGAMYVPGHSMNHLGTNKTNFYGALRWTTKDKDVKGQGTVFVTKELMVI